jgi:hypothetical protein
MCQLEDDWWLELPTTQNRVANKENFRRLPAHPTKFCREHFCELRKTFADCLFRIQTSPPYNFAEKMFVNGLGTEASHAVVLQLPL